MSFPLDIIPMMDRVTEMRLAAEAKGDQNRAIVPQNPRAHNEQTCVQEETHRKTDSYTNKPPANHPVEQSSKKKTWEKLMRRLRMAEKKKRQSGDSDSIMQRAFEHPMTMDEQWPWTTELNNLEEAQWARTNGRHSQDVSRQASQCLRGRSESGEEDEITALPAMPGYSDERNNTRRETTKLVKKAKSMKF